MNLSDLARQLYATHGLLPVPVTGKIPLGGLGWDTLPLERRLELMPQATGLGIQFGLTFHPKLGPVEARAIDADIDDIPERNAFAAGVPFANQWRWGRRPATIVFTEPGIIKQEKFGKHVQLLGAGKQAVWFGAYQNKSPLPSDPVEYWYEGPSIFEQLPPVIPAAALRTALETATGCQTKSMLIESALSSDDIAMLTPENISFFRDEIKSMLIDIQHSPTGSGRGNKLHHLGVKYGALIKASGTAPTLADAAHISPDYVPFEIKKHAYLEDIGRIAEDAFISLPGTLGAGDKRDFARGVGASKGYGQVITLEKQKHALLMPTGRAHAGQTATDLLKLNMPPMSYLVDRFLPDTGCIILAGKPKVGKGWIIMDLALQVIEGGVFWGQRARQGGVLMYMMEDGPRRITERLRMIHPGVFGVEAAQLRFRYSADGPFYVDSNGTGSLVTDIEKHLADFKNIRLVVVDVLQRVRGTVERSDNAYQVDYKVVAALQKLAVQNSVLILVVHHTKKGKVDDAIDGISGSFGIIGAADGAIIVGKEGEVMRAQSTMRDIPDFEFDLVKEEGNPMWKPAQGAMEALGTSMKPNAVLHALLAAACELNTGDVAIRAKISEATTAVYLSRLVKSGQATRTARGFYKATGIPARDRIEGVKDVIKSMLLTPVTDEIEAKYAPKGAPDGATFMAMTDKVLSEIKACFIGEKKALDALKSRGLVVYNSDTAWLIGSEWQTKHQTQYANPFAMRMPWQ